MSATSCDPGLGNDTFEILDCAEFYPHFLDPISEDVRKNLISVIHELSKDGASSENARDRCEEILITVEKELGVDSFICEIVAKELTECLRKLDLATDMIDFMDSRIERLKKKDFGTLLVLGSIFELSGDYSKALNQRNEGLKLAEVSGDPVLICLSLAKQACDFWHLHRCDEAQRNVSLCLEKLENVSVSPTVDHFPFTESVHRLIDLYKTLGYIHRFLSDRSTSAEYYKQALDIVKQDTKALVHVFKLETQIGCEYSNSKVGFKSETIRYSLSAYEKIQSFAENESFMQFHSLTIIHALSRVAHSLKEADLSRVLPIREKLYNIAEKYLSQNHPEVARIAADTAYLCCNINEREKESEYIDKAVHALENCENDLGYLKLHVREISDAWKSLGLLYSKRRNMREAERAYKEAIQINKRVYGASHPRLARLYRSLGLLYRKEDKFSDAIAYLNSCKEINDEFSPTDTVLRKQLKKEISICRNLERKSYY